jgi:2-polyprenyl-3-methyl-5-hydroxy-6-metoxy-1,4-benzoquinol methylase
MSSVMKEGTDYEQLWSQEWCELQRIGPLTHSNHRLILKLLRPHLIEGCRILDVGCGNGALLERLSMEPLDLRLAGIEGSEQAVARAPESLRSRILRRDITNGFSFDGETFDILICSEVLEHLSDYRPALESIAAHTRPDGYALITVPHSMAYWSDADRFAGHYRRFEYEDFRHELKRYRLDPIKYFTWGFPVSYLYYFLVRRVEPAKLMRQSNSPLRTFVANLVYHAMKIDDSFTGKRWHQLITLARKK